MKSIRHTKGLALLIAVITLITLVLNMINGRFQMGDFKVYYTAAFNLVSGGPVYLTSFYTGSGFYKYSPATLFFFLPYTIFGFKSAAILHFFLLGTTYFYTFLVIGKLITRYFSIESVPLPSWLLSVSFVSILLHFTREMYLGNINIILMLFCCLSLLTLLQGRNGWSGFFMGLAVLAKPYLLIMLIPLVLRQKFNAVKALFLTIAVGLMIPFLYPGPERGYGLYAGWISTILNHQDDFPGRTSLDYVAGIVAPSVSSIASWILPGLLVGSVIILILRNLHLEKQRSTTHNPADTDIAFEWFILLAFIPNLIKSDWVILLFSAPLITFMFFYIARSRKYGWIPLIVLLLFFYGANSDDLLGRQLSHTILESGLMGVSNFLLLVVSVAMFIDFRQKRL